MLVTPSLKPSLMNQDRPAIATMATAITMMVCARPGVLPVGLRAPTATGIAVLLPAQHAGCRFRRGLMPLAGTRQRIATIIMSSP